MNSHELKCRKCGAVFPEKWECEDCGMVYIGCMECGAEYSAFLASCPSCNSENQSRMQVSQSQGLLEAFPDFGPVREFLDSLATDAPPLDESEPRTGDEHDFVAGRDNPINGAMGPTGMTLTDVPIDSSISALGLERESGPPLTSPEIPAPSDALMLNMGQSMAMTPVFSSPESLPERLFGQAMSALQSRIPAPSTDQPVWLSMETGRTVRRGQQGLLNLRFEAASIERLTHFELECQSGVLSAPHLQQGEIEPGECLDLNPVVFVPQLAGQYPFKLTLTFSDGRGLPQSRWTTKCVLSVEETQSCINYNVQGDFIVGAIERGSIPGLDPDMGTSTEWNTLRLQRDSSYDRRIRKLCPSIGTPVPGLPEGITGPPAVLHGVATLSHQWKQVRIGIHVGQTVVLGRGELPDVNIPFCPEPFDARQFGRLSRAHAQLDFACGRIWLTSLGSNFTRLNGEELARRRRVLLADGDELSLAGVIDLVVRLYAADGQVCAAYLWRRDTHAHRLCYAFILPGRVLPCVLEEDEPLSDPLGWLAWSSDPKGGILVHARLRSDASWSLLDKASCSNPAGFRCDWKQLPPGTQHSGGYRDQSQYLQ